MSKLNEKSYMNQQNDKLENVSNISTSTYIINNDIPVANISHHNEQKYYENEQYLKDNFIDPRYQTDIDAKMNNDRRYETKLRNKTSSRQLETLERISKTVLKPDKALRQQLSIELGMSQRQVQIWFQNKRAKLKKHNELPPSMYRKKSIGYMGDSLNPNIKEEIQAPYEIYQNSPFPNMVYQPRQGFFQACIDGIEPHENYFNRPKAFLEMHNNEYYGVQPMGDKGKYEFGGYYEFPEYCYYPPNVPMNEYYANIEHSYGANAKNKNFQGEEDFYSRKENSKRDQRFNK